MKYKVNNRAFTLMEVIIAVAVIVMGLAVSISLITFSVSGVRIGESKIVAAGLVQEGLEIVRNIRDSNWLSYKRKSDGGSDDWRNGLAVGDYRVQYDELSLLFFNDMALRIDNSGRYQYDSGSTTPFYRKITIEHIANNQIKITSEVTWQERGRNQSIKTESVLWNWLEE